MSYRTDVKIALSRAGYKKIKSLFESKFPYEPFLLDMADNIYICKNSSDIIVFSFDSFDCWDISNKAQIIEELLNIIEEQGFGYNLVKVGENVDDISESFIYGSSESEKFKVLSLVPSIKISDNFING